MAGTSDVDIRCTIGTLPEVMLTSAVRKVTKEHLHKGSQPKPVLEGQPYQAWGICMIS